MSSTSLPDVGLASGEIGRRGYPGFLLCPEQSYGQGIQQRLKSHVPSVKLYVTLDARFHIFCLSHPLLTARQHRKAGCA